MTDLIVRDDPHTMSAAEIYSILPHRYPFALLDRVLDYEPGVWAIAEKNISFAEPVFQGHFPGNPVFPGVLQLEALAQAGAVSILSLEENRNKLALFGGVKNARFKRPVLPGDTLTLMCELTRIHGPLGFADAKALVNGKTVCTAELSFAITDNTSDKS